MKKEIKRRKKVFGAFLAAVLFFAMQLAPSVVNAASYMVKEDKTNYSYYLDPDCSILYPGDVVKYEWYSGAGYVAFIYLDKNENSSVIKIEYGSTENWEYTISDYSGKDIDKEAFKGWKVNSIVGSSGSPQNIELRALEYEKSSINYKFTDDTLFSNDASNPSYYYEGKENIVLKDAVSSSVSYEFDGWYSDSDYAHKVTEITADMTGDLTLYAKFNLKKYSIVYFTDGGALVSSNPLSYVYGEGVQEFNPADKTGYTFDGWYSEPEFINKVTSIPADSTGDIKLYAKYSPRVWKIQYKLDGGTNNADNPSEYTYGVGVPEFKPATKTGYTFDGWYLDNEFNYPISSLATNKMNNIVIYAKFTANKYGITYELNGGTNDSSNPTEYTYGTGVSEFKPATKTGYTFDGWYSDADYKTKVTGISETSIEAVKLYAKFTKIEESKPGEIKPEEPKPENPSVEEPKTEEPETVTEDVKPEEPEGTVTTADAAPLMAVILVMLLSGTVVVTVSRKKRV